MTQTHTNENVKGKKSRVQDLLIYNRKKKIISQIYITKKKNDAKFLLFYFSVLFLFWLWSLRVIFFT